MLICPAGSADRKTLTGLCQREMDFKQKKVHAILKYVSEIFSFAANIIYQIYEALVTKKKDTA